jgi:hypothetical protein
VKDASEAHLKREATIRRRDAEVARDMPERASGEDKREIWRRASAEFLSFLRKPGLTLRAPIARRLKSGRESARSVSKIVDDDWTRLLGALLPRPGQALSPKQPRREAGKGANWDAALWPRPGRHEGYFGLAILVRKCLTLREERLQ